MRGDALSERFLDFAARILRLVQAIPKTLRGRHVAGQLLRCGTSMGSNYEEARGAESRQDFIHKLAVSWKESRESCFWLKLVHHSRLLRPPLVEPLLKESEEVSRILSASLTTARKKKN